MDRLEKLHGVIVPIITPLTPEEQVDVHALRRLVDYLLAPSAAVPGECPVQGIFVNSTTGEGLALQDKQQAMALETVLEAVAGRALVLAGISEVSTARALQKLRSAEAAGADIAVAHPPFYYPTHSQTEIVAYFSELASHANVPLMLYNIPSMCKTPISLETVETLMAIDNIIGIKDSSTDYLNLIRLLELKAARRPDFRVFIGKTQLWTAGAAAGADGLLDGISNLIPDLCFQLYSLVAAGKLAQAFALQKKVNAIWDVYRDKPFLAAIKTALHVKGLCAPTVCRPYAGLHPDQEAEIRTILETHGLL